MFYTKFYISLLDLYRFDGEHYVVGRNENMLRVRVKRHGGDYYDRGSGSTKPQRACKARYRNFWADRVLQCESQSVTHAIVSEGIVDSMIHGFDNIILACGPHCSGKTFNITGWNRKCEGIAPRLIEDMLALQKDGLRRDGGSVYAMSCVEIKDNRVFDLLNDDDDSKNVSKHEFDSPGTARQMLRKASAKRSVTVREDNEVPPSHVCDFVITFYCWHVSPGEEAATADSSCAKVHVVELAGVGPHDAKPLKYQNQNNRTALALRDFLEHISTKHGLIDDHRNSEWSALVKYCKGSFLKLGTTLRILCHIRPQLEFLSSNLSVLKFGETLRKLKTSEISVPMCKSKATELQMHMEHLTHEMRIYGQLEGLKSLFNMTTAHYERSRTDVLNFLQFKSDDIVVRKWNHVDAFTVLSVFREYYDMISTEKHEKKNRNEYVRFPLKSSPIDKDAINQEAENIRYDVNETLQTVLCCDDDAPTDERRHHWEAFIVANSTVTLERERIMAKIREAHRSFETALEHTLDVQEKLNHIRDTLDKLRRERRVRGDERYDGDVNAIVPDAEKRALLSTWRADAEMAAARDELVRAQTHLTSATADRWRFDDAARARFQIFVQIHDGEENANDSNSITDKKLVASTESPTKNGAHSETKLDEIGSDENPGNL